MTDPATSCCCADWVSTLARSHAGRLAAIARREGINPTDALDVVQDAFQVLIARDDAPSLREHPEDAARVLATIVRNGARNLRRRHHQAKPHVDIEVTPLPAASPAPDEALVNALTAAQLEGCMASLGDVHRHVVTLRVLEELSGDEAAPRLASRPVMSPCCCIARASSSSAAWRASCYRSRGSRGNRWS